MMVFKRSFLCEETRAGQASRIVGGEILAEAFVHAHN